MIFVGTGTHFHELRELVKINLSHIVYFMGLISNVNKIIIKSDIGIFPSIFEVFH